ncbi:hypothetical protein KAS56_07050, partial [candidate division WOR-3 bacterium]|nr:hypothetical protein [candidate division WOR-3 bacterium]
VMDNPKFVAGDYDTTFIDKVLGKVEYKKHYYEIAAISSAIGKILNEKRATVSAAKKEAGVNPWKLSSRLKMMRRRI